MSGPALLYVASLVMSGKAVVDGLKEGNLAKAVLGGVGGYMAISGLGTLNAAAGEAGNATAAAAGDLGTEAAGKVAEAAAPAMSPAATATPMDAINNLGTVNAEAQGMSAVGQGVTAGPATQPGFLSRVGNWAQKNPMLAYGGMQVGGSVLSGMAQGEMMDEQLAERRKAEERMRADEAARRDRIGTQANTGFLKRFRYDPMVGNFVENTNG